MGVSRTIWRTGAAPISLAVGRQETRTTHSVQHNGETCECHLSVPLYPTLLLKQQIIRRFSLCRPSSNRPTVYCPILYTILSCPVLPCPLFLPTHIRTCTHTYLGLRGFWQRACWTHHFEPDKSPPFQSLKCLGCCSFTSTAAALRCTALHGTGCTALAPQAWIGLDGGVGLGCRASERAKRLSYCAARLASLSLSHHCILCPLSTFKFLLTGSPRQFQPAFPPLLPGLNSVICSLPLSPLST